jgi:hypothetical protein
LCARFTRAKNNFRKTLASRARMVHARVSDIFVMKIPNAFGRLGFIEFSSTVGFQQAF